MFSNKLNFLMDVTNTKNSALANAVSLDASHVSRLRHGGRKLPQNQNFLMPMAVYLTKQIKSDYQKKIIREALKLDDEWSEKESIMADIVYEWLKTDDAAESFSFTKESALPVTSEKKSCLDSRIYYGDDGRRKAILSLLETVLEYPKPQTLYIADEEDLIWLTENPLYKSKLEAMLFEAIKRGDQIISLHRLNRSPNEIVDEIRNWIPFFLTEKVTPFYYPKYREEIHRASAYLAVKSGFVFSHSISGTRGGGFSLLTRDKFSIKSAITDFQSHLAKCRPLLGVYNKLTIPSFLKHFSEKIVPAATNTMRRDFFPYTAFIPEDIAIRLTEARLNPSLMKILARDREITLDNLSKYHFLDVFPLLSAEELSEHTLFYSNLRNFKDRYLNIKDYIDVLENVIVVLRKYENYHVRIAKLRPDDPCVLIKEGSCMTLANQQLNSSLLFTEERLLVDAFWSFLEYKNEKLYLDLNAIVGKEKVIKAIKEHIKTLRDSISEKEF